MKEALYIFSKILEIYPNDSNIYFKLGNALHKNGDYEGALENYLKSVEKDPKNNDSYHNIFIVIKNNKPRGV